jgi:uncharacterized protein YpmS
MNNEGQNAAAAANNQMVNQLETIKSNLKADIPVFYGDISKDSVTAKFYVRPQHHHCTGNIQMVRRCNCGKLQTGIERKSY